MKIRFWSKTYKHKCPDGSVKIVHKDIDDAFPLYIPGFSGNIDSKIDVLKKAKGQIKAEFASKIQGLLYELEETQKDIMFIFRLAYAGYTTDPCANSSSFQKQVNELITQRHQINILKTKINGLIVLAAENKNPKEVMRVYQEILNGIGRTGEAAAYEIDQNREAAQKWIGGRNEG